MSQTASSLLQPVPWKSDLVGEFPGQECRMELAPDVPMLFCWCPPTPPGQPFVMGSPPDEPERRDNETQRKEEIPKGFWLAKHPVNQQQWQAVMGNNPSQQGKEDSFPMHSVSWNDAQEFCRKTGLRLPREVEWEYACRAGTTTPFGIGGGQCLNAQLANFEGNSPYGSGRESFQWLDRQGTLPQGSFPPNAWGLHDMHGQLWEWCEDELTEGRDRVLRGGSWFYLGWFARSAFRHGFVSEFRSGSLGFRPCPSSTKPGPEARSSAERARSEVRDERNDSPA